MQGIHLGCPQNYNLRACWMVASMPFESERTLDCLVCAALPEQVLVGGV